MPTPPRPPASRGSQAGAWTRKIRVAKLCAFREKDLNFVAALLDAQLVDGDVITTRLRSLPTTHRVATGRALAWLASRRRE